MFYCQWLTSWDCKLLALYSCRMITSHSCSVGARGGQEGSLWIWRGCNEVMRLPFMSGPQFCLLDSEKSPLPPKVLEVQGDNIKWMRPLAWQHELMERTHTHRDDDGNSPQSPVLWGLYVLQRLLQVELIVSPPSMREGSEAALTLHRLWCRNNSVRYNIGSRVGGRAPLGIYLFVPQWWNWTDL